MKGGLFIVASFWHANAVDKQINLWLDGEIFAIEKKRRCRNVRTTVNRLWGYFVDAHKSGFVTSSFFSAPLYFICVCFSIHTHTHTQWSISTCGLFQNRGERAICRGRLCGDSYRIAHYAQLRGAKVTGKSYHREGKERIRPSPGGRIAQPVQITNS